MYCAISSSFWRLLDVFQGFLIARLGKEMAETGGKLISTLPKEVVERFGDLAQLCQMFHGIFFSQHVIPDDRQSLLKQLFKL